MALVQPLSFLSSLLSLLPFLSLPSTRFRYSSVAFGDELIELPIHCSFFDRPYEAIHCSFFGSPYEGHDDGALIGSELIEPNDSFALPAHVATSTSRYRAKTWHPLRTRSVVTT